MRIEIVNGSFSYPKQNPLFQNVSFSLEDSSVMTVLGRNGVGKTTLLKCIMGILEWKTGNLIVDGKEMKNANKIKEIAYVPQAHQVVFSYTIREFVVMGRTRYMGYLATPSKFDYECAEEAIERVGLADLKNRLCSQLSGGQLQMVYIARALAANPKLIILDEPESHLDFHNQFFVLDVLKRIRDENQVSMIINTHYPEHVMELSDKTLFLGKGDFLFGDTKDLLTEENIEHYFQVTSVIDTVIRRNRKIPVFAVTGHIEHLK